MSYTKDQLKALKDALALGLEEVQFKDHRQRFRSRKDMELLIAKIERDLGMTPSSSSTTRRKVSFSKGIK